MAKSRPWALAQSSLRSLPTVPTRFSLVVHSNPFSGLVPLLVLHVVQFVVVVTVADDATIMREEIFGPVGCFASFKTTEEVILRANDSPYGLAAAVWSSSIDTIMKIADGVDAGTIWCGQCRATTGYLQLSRPLSWGAVLQM